MSEKPHLSHGGHGRIMAMLVLVAGCGGDSPAQPAEECPASGIRVEPEDTMVFLAATFDLRPRLTSASAAGCESRITFAALTATLSVTPDGRVRGEEFGRGLVETRYERAVVSTWVSVVPQGRLAAENFPFDSGDTIGIFAAEMDGVDYRLYAWGEEHHQMPTGRPSWAPSGRDLVFYRGWLSELQHGDLAGNFRTVTPDTLVDWPVFSPDAQWIYYTIRGLEGSQEIHIWRVRPDGSDRQRVSPPSERIVFDIAPSLSPDGRRLAFVSDRSGNHLEPSLHVLTIDTGELFDTRVLANTPRWSPTDDRIAFVAGGDMALYGSAGTIYTIRADGSDIRRVSEEDRYFPGLSWSPDAQWLIATAKDSFQLEIINIETGLVVPLIFPHVLVNPSWGVR